MPTVQELYELWATDDYADLKEALQQSLEPRGSDSLLAMFAELGPRPGQVVLDIGARDAVGAITLARTHGLRAIALDPVPLHCDRARKAVAEAGLTDEIEVVEGAIEDLPLADASADWIWCRDVLVHVDARQGLAECARVLRPGGAMVAYLTLATERLEERELAELMNTCAIEADSMDPAGLEAAAEAAGLVLHSIDALASEWRERWIEDEIWDPGQDLLALARLDRRRDALVERYGTFAVEAARNGLLWGIYQLLGKLRPAAYVWERRA
jgi:SAM-dependent methyltransferase